MARANLSKRTVDAVEPASRDQFIWDASLTGFGLKVTPLGRKVFIFQYRIAPPGEASKTAAKRYTIGKYGNVTPDQARKRAEVLAGMVANGIDPRQAEKDQATEKRQQRAAAERKERLESELAFSAYADRWLDHYEHEKGRRPKSVAAAKAIVRNYLKPALGNLPMPHIGRDELQPIIDAIPAKQRATRRNVFAYASILFGWATRRGDVPANPLAAMEKPPAPAPRQRVLSDDEIKAVWLASFGLTKPFGQFFRFLILSGQRRNEVAGMAWQELDRESRAWTIPSERAKNNGANIVPLGPTMIAELDALAGAAEDDKPVWPKTGFVLTTKGNAPISGMSKAKAALDSKVAKARDDEPLPHWQIHDLRRTLATGFQRMGIRLEVTEATINHISGSRAGIVGVYQLHDWAEEKRAALEAWDARILTLVSGEKADNVIAMRPALAV